MKKLTRKEKVKLQEQEDKLKRDLEQYKAKSNLSKFFLIFGIIFLIIFGNIWINRNATIEDSELKTIDVHFSHEVKKEWKKSIGNYIKIQLDEYPDTKFRIGRHGSNNVNLYELNEQIRNGKSLNIQILKREFEKLKRKKTIWVYGIRDIQKSYFDVSDYNEQKQKDRNSIYTYLLIGFSLWLILHGLNIQIKNRKPADNKL